jgi:heterotetrameric sarcosine oxidase delta subunit
MLRIPCPYCGLRDQTEFTYGGDAGVPRPADTDTTDNHKWDDYLYFRDNPAGKHREYWQHTLGCRQWFRLVRDTVTNKILEEPRNSESET